MKVWVAYSIFVREASDISLGFMDHCPIHHYIHFYVNYPHTLMQVDHHSLFYLFALFYLYFYFPISLYLIWFISFLILHDVWLGFNIHTLFLLIRYVCSSIITFRVGILRSATHDVFYILHISCMRDMGFISFRLLSLVSFRFFHLIASTYVTSHVLRPP